MDMHVEARINELLLSAAQNDYERSLEMRRPSNMLRPSIGLDGNKWCALYGEDLMPGVAGFGDTPELAMLDFDRNWINQKAPTLAPIGEGN